MTKNNIPEQDSGFSAGLTLGLLAGAMGMFLMGTRKGATVRKKLAQEWEAAQEYLHTQGLLSDQQQQSVSQLLSLIKQRVIEEAGLHTPPTVEEPVKKTSKRRSYQKKASPRQFKGV